MGRAGTVGISLDTFTVKMVVADQRGALTHAEAELAAGVISHTGIHNPSALADAIEAACAAVGFRPRRARIALPPGLCTVRPLSLPPLQARELREAIPWEMERYLPYPAEAATFGHVIIDPIGATAGGADQRQALVAAAPTAAIEAVGEALKSLRITPTLFTPRAWALAAASPDLVDGASHVIVEVSDDHLFIGSVLRGRLIAARALPLLVESTAATEIAVEIERSLPYLQPDARVGAEPSGLWIAAERSVGDAVAHELQARLNYRVQPLRTRLAIADAGRYAAAVGVTEPSPFPIDLRSEREQNQHRSSLLRPLMIVAPALTLATLVTLQVVDEARLVQRDHELAPLLIAHRHRDAQHRAAQVLREQLSMSEAELALLRAGAGLASDLTGAVRTFAASLAASAAGAVHFEELALQQIDDRIEARLIARGRNATAITSFLSALEAEPNWTLSNPSLARERSDGSTTLALQARYDRAGER